VSTLLQWHKGLEERESIQTGIRNKPSNQISSIKRN